MMDAQLVWNTWRRVLTRDRLIEWVHHPDTRSQAPDGVTVNELAILADYACTPAATDANIGMYRRGLVRNALGALDLVPLSRRLLAASGLDGEAVAAEFTRFTGYADNGPNFWRTAAEFVEYLASRPEFATCAQQDVLAIDAATIALARRLGESAGAVWPDAAAATCSAADESVDEEPARFVATGAAVVVSSHHDLTPWIENPFDFDAAEEIEVAPRQWLIYFPAAEAAHEYAELSERAARVVNLLRTPTSAAELSLALEGLPSDEVLAVINSLATLGVVVREGNRHGLPATLPKDAFVMLDPAVELLDAEIAEHRLLGHGYFAAGMVVPPGDGLVDFVTSLMHQPVELAALRAQFDDQQMIDKMLLSLREQGFLHVTSHEPPSTEELAHCRGIAEQRRSRRLRRSLTLDLDAPIAIDQIQARLAAEGSPPELLLRCARLVDHQKILAELAHLRQAGAVRMHLTVVHTGDLSADREICRTLIRLGASVTVEGVRWPVPDQPIPGLDEMTRNCVAVHAMMTPDLSILEDAVRGRALAWAGSVFISGLCFRLDADALWPAGDAEEADFLGVFTAVRAVEDEFGDVLIENLPSDEVLLGNTASAAPPGPSSDLADHFRLSYVRWRLPVLKSCENDNSWSQIPEVEDKLVRAHLDLLPNHPEFLRLRPGCVVVDVCGGLGRVARRLSPAVGDDGLIISLEMFRCVSDRARRFACEKGMTNLHFRPGLAQRIPLPDGTADAAVNEWTGGIWELGLGPTMVREMARVIRPGGRIAATHRLAQLDLESLSKPWVQYDDIYRWMCDAFRQPELEIVEERVWGQIVPSLVGENATHWRKQYMPRLINPHEMTYKYDASPDTRADVYLTIIAERR